MKKIYFLFSIFYFLFSSAAFAQFSPISSGLIPSLFGQVRRKASLPPSIVEQVPVLFTGPSWCEPCKAEWRRGGDSDVEAIVIVGSDGNRWIFPKSSNIFGDPVLLSKNVDEQYAAQHGGQRYTGPVPSGVPARGTVSSSALPGNIVIQVNAKKIVVIQISNSKGPIANELARLEVVGEINFIFINYKSCKTSTKYKNKLVCQVTMPNGRVVTIDDVTFLNNGSNYMIFENNSRWPNDRVDSYIDEIRKNIAPKPPKIEEPPPVNTFTGDETVEILRLIDVDYVDGKPMIDVEVKICVGDQCRMEIWKISIEEFRKLKKSKTPIDPTKPLSQPIDAQEKELKKAVQEKEERLKKLQLEIERLRNAK